MIISTKISFIPSRCTRTKQQDPDSPIHSFPIALEDLFYLDIPLLGIFFRRISGFGTHATHGELSNGLNLKIMLAIGILKTKMPIY